MFQIIFELDTEM